jgi:hypothetical protein
MKPIKKKLIIKMFITFLFIICLNLSINARFFVNGSDGGYPPEKVSRSISIEAYVVDAAGYFLKGYSDIQRLLELYELQDKIGINHEEWQGVLGSTLSNMSSAAQTYALLIEKAEATPYNEEFISRLMDFDYPGFAKEQGLNAIIFKECAAYLKEGDITGMYKRISAKFADILDMLKTVEEDLTVNKITELSLIWRLNETCAELSLFGQYASRVFYAVMEK